MMKLYIRSMVSFRCNLFVKTVMQQLGLHVNKMELGEVEVLEDLSPVQLSHLKQVLQEGGLELMDDRKSILIDKIRNSIIHIIHYSKEPPIENFSDYLSEKLQYDYTYLANLFSNVTGTTIEHCLIAHKIEKAKELILYDELSLTEIAKGLNYSSVGHLSKQFKKVTGLTPSFFKQLKNNKRIPLEDICNENS